MPLVNSDIQLIENYIRDTCSPEEIKHFEEKIVSNQEFKNAYTLELLISEQVISGEEASMKGMLSDIHTELAGEGFFEEVRVIKGNFFERNKVAMSLAASVMLLFAALFLIDGNDQEEMFANADSIEEAFINTRLLSMEEVGFASSDQDQGKINLLKNLSSGSLSADGKLAATDNESIYFNGLLDFKLGKYDEALKSFKTVMDSSNPDYRERASFWYARIVLTKGGEQKERALEILRNLADSDSAFKGIALNVLTEYD